MHDFPNIEIEGNPYPTVILGEDNFTGWFGKGSFNSEAERGRAYHLTVKTAYELGVTRLFHAEYGIL